MATFETFEAPANERDPFAGGRTSAGVPQEYLDAVRQTSKDHKLSIRIDDDSDGKDIVRVLRAAGKELNGTCHTRIVTVPVKDKAGRNTGRTSRAVAFYLGPKITHPGRGGKGNGTANGHTVDAAE
jgi:hypothetical protein